MVLKDLDNNISAKYLGENLKLIETDFKYLTGSQKEQYKNQRKLTPSFSAPDYHPWGYKVFLIYLHKSNNLNRYLKK